jgi:Tfp pilus assembly protein PilV
MKLAAQANNEAVAQIGNLLFRRLATCGVPQASGAFADCQSATQPTASRRYAAAFTLAEVLAALLFLAIVIPTAVEALHVASLAGEVATRKAAAARVADRVLNESLVTTNWMGGMQSGTVTEGILDFRWKLTSQSWPQDSMQLLTAEVTYSAQGKDYSVKLSTLANSQNNVQPSGTSTITQ